MTQAMSKLAMSLLMRCLTETFVAKMIVHGLRAMADSTENKIDDKIVDDVKEALGV